MAMASTLVSIYLLGDKKQSGFLFGVVSNLAWFTFGFMVHSVANMLANVVLLVINVRGYVRWRGMA